MSHEGLENETSPERILSREEILIELHKRCESFDIVLEKSDEQGIYILDVKAVDGVIYAYQRKRPLPGQPQGMESAGTTIRVEWADGSYAKTLADYDPISNKWVEQ